MSVYDTLCAWYLMGDRRKRDGGGFDVMVPDSLMQQMIHEAAKWEDREAERHPFETSETHEKRTGTNAR